MKTAVLFLNGYTNIVFCEDYYMKHYHGIDVFCADGAYYTVKDNKTINPFIKHVIGDRDSLPQHLFYDNLYVLDNDQNTTDFEKCLSYLAKHNYTEVHIFGANGKEMDHYLANLSAIIHYKDRMKFKIIDQHGISFLADNHSVFSNIKGKMISIVPLFNMKNVTLTGCAFNLSNETLTFGDKIGCRNHAIFNDVHLSYDSGLALVFLSYDEYHHFVLTDF